MRRNITQLLSCSLKKMCVFYLSELNSIRNSKKMQSYKLLFLVLTFMIVGTMLNAQPFIRTNGGYGQYGYIEKDAAATNFWVANGGYGNIYQYGVRTYVMGPNVTKYNYTNTGSCARGDDATTNYDNSTYAMSAGNILYSSVFVEYCGPTYSCGSMTPTGACFNERSFFVLDVVPKTDALVSNACYSSTNSNVVLTFTISNNNTSGQKLNRLWLINEGTASESSDIYNGAFELYYEAATGTETFNGSESHQILWGDYNSNSTSNNVYGHDALGIDIPQNSNGGLRCYVVLKGTSTNLSSSAIGKTIKMSIIADGISITPNRDSNFSLLHIDKTQPSPTAITIVGTAASSGTITGTSTQCPGLTNQTYSIGSVTNATTYNWVVPTGWTITAGQNSTSITVTTGNAGQNGNVTVTAGNSCGTSSPQSLAVTVNPSSLTWVGGASGAENDWNTAANWAPASIPTACADVIIPTGLTNYPTLSAAGTCKNIAIESGASLLDNGYLTVTGTASVERFITKYGVGSDKMFHFLSSPVAGQSISPQFSDPPNNTTDDFYKFGESTYEWINFRGATVNVPNSSFGESNFVVGRGYLVAYNTDYSKTFTGTLNSGTLNSGTGLPALTYTSTLGTNAGWNLMGNPYPSAIAWDNVTSEQYANLDNAVYVRDNASSTYKTWVSGVGTLTNGIIPAMQGFFVHAYAASPTLYLENQDRVHGGATYYKKSSVAENVIHLKIEGNERNDDTFVRFTNDATFGFDRQWDAYKLYGEASVPNFYTLAGDTKLAVNSLPLNAMVGTVPLAVEAGTESTYTISLEENSLSSLIDVKLEDLKTGLLMQLNVEPSYTFTATPGDNPNRFLLHFLNTTGTNKPVASAIKVYSTAGKINISGMDGKAEVLVRNMMGQVVLRNSVNGEKFYSVNSANLPAGVYVISVVSGRQTESEKVVVK